MFRCWTTHLQCWDGGEMRHPGTEIDNLTFLTAFCSDRSVIGAYVWNKECSLKVLLNRLSGLFHIYVFNHTNSLALRECCVDPTLKLKYFNFCVDCHISGYCTLQQLTICILAVGHWLTKLRLSLYMGQCYAEVCSHVVTYSDAVIHSSFHLHLVHKSTRPLAHTDRHCFRLYWEFSSDLSLTQRCSWHQ